MTLHTCAPSPSPSQSPSPPFETKVSPFASPSRSADSLHDLQDDLMQTLTAFQNANDQRLKEIEAKSSADVVLSEKVDRLNMAIETCQKRLDDWTLKTQRPLFSTQHLPTNITDSHDNGHRVAFERYVRKGNHSDLALFESKALAAGGSGPDGGYLVPAETEASVDRLLAQISPMRKICDVRHVSVPVYKKPFVTSGVATGWVGETTDRAQTNTPTLTELQFPAAEIYAMPAATQTMLDDGMINIDQWLAQEVHIAFATQEGEAFITGDGQNKPKGFLASSKVSESSWSFGHLGYLATGANGAFTSTNAADSLISLVYTLKSGYRQNAVFMMSRKTQAEVRKLKDASGAYLWQPTLSGAKNPTLLNFPIIEAEAMPAVEPDSFSIAFGDFRSGYLIVDRVGIRMLRDPYTLKPYVLFYTTKRVGGGVQNFEAIKLLKFSAS